MSEKFTIKCPFCGHDAEERYVPRDGLYSFYCPNCYAFTPAKNSLEEAMEAVMIKVIREKEKDMTNDTKRALELIEPMAKELNIEVKADDKLLYCNGQAIGIACNSTYATINEFLGYAFLRMCQREYRFREGIEEAKTLRGTIKRYWVSDALLAKLRGTPEETLGECATRLNRTIREIARRTGISEMTLSRYNLRQRVPSEEDAKLIGKALAVDWQYVIRLCGGRTDGRTEV